MKSATLIKLLQKKWLEAGAHTRQSSSVFASGFCSSDHRAASAKGYEDRHADADPERRQAGLIHAGSNPLAQR